MYLLETSFGVMFVKKKKVFHLFAGLQCNDRDSIVKLAFSGLIR